MSKFFSLNTEQISVRSDENENIVTGYASVFNSRSNLIAENGKVFIEVIREGAFDEALQRKDLNVLAVVNHQRDKLLARSKSGTLSLNVDEKGLKYSFTLPKTSLGTDIREMLERGDIDSSSFKYSVEPKNIVWKRESDGTLLREIVKIDRLYDISVVVDPAFSDANATLSAREYEEIETQLNDEQVINDEVIKEETVVEETIESTTPEPERSQVVEDEVTVEAPAENETIKDDELAVEKRELIETNNNKNLNKMIEKNLLESVREALDSNMGGTVVSQRAAADGDTTAMAAAVPKYVKELDILGYEPLWKSIGADVMTGAQGTFVLPYESPIVGAQIAELSAVSGDTAVPTGILVSPKRYSVKKTFTVETLASATPEFLQAVLADMVKGCDRAITKAIYTKLIAISGTGKVGGAITKAGFDILQGAVEVENDGAFFADRASFYTAKGTVIDAGSGRFLAEKSEFAGKGVCYDGTPFWYSNLFEDGTNLQYVIYGDPSKIFVADYGNVEVIVDKYTLAANGQVVITVNKLADVAVKNPGAFCKSPDLDSN